MVTELTKLGPIFDIQFIISTTNPQENMLKLLVEFFSSIFRLNSTNGCHIIDMLMTIYYAPLMTAYEDISTPLNINGYVIV